MFTLLSCGMTTLRASNHILVACGGAAVGGIIGASVEKYYGTQDYKRSVLKGAVVGAIAAGLGFQLGEASLHASVREGIQFLREHKVDPTVLTSHEALSKIEGFGQLSQAAQQEIAKLLKIKK
jgi:hypothetical protein